MNNFTDAERTVFSICVTVDTFFASVFFAFLVYYKLTRLFSRYGRWAQAGDRMADWEWGRGNWEYSEQWVTKRS